VRTRRAISAVLSLTAGLAMVLTSTPALAAATPADLLLSEYVEGSSNNKALEFFNGTGAPIDLAAGAYNVQIFFNGAATAGATINLTGTVATGDVFVLAAASASATILAVADQTTGASLYNGDDAIVLRKGTDVVDSFGQVGVDPGTEWGAGLTSSADNTLRRSATVIAGDTNPADAFDPATQWIGYATDTFDGLGAHSIDGTGDQPATLSCGATLTLSQGIGGERVVSAVDADDEITDLAVTVNPTPASGSISRTTLSPAGEVGGTASATVTVTSDVPAGSYVVTVTSTDADATTATCGFTVQVTKIYTVGEIQGATGDAENPRTDRSPFAPASGNGTSSLLYDVRGVITQRTLARTSAGADQYGFFLQSRTTDADFDATSSDGIFVFMGGFTSLIGGYVPVVGDEVVLRARVSEYFFMTQLSSASLVTQLATGLNVRDEVTVTDARPPADSAAADRFWERHEGEQLRVRAGSAVTGARDVFSSTMDSEIWLIDRDDPLMARENPYTRRVYRDAHPMDNDPLHFFDDGNGDRILIGSLGVKWTARDNTTLVPPASDFDLVETDAVGGLMYNFEKYSVQPEAIAFDDGVDPAGLSAPREADRNEEFSVATFNVENLYDYRDDPFDGCDFTGNSGCTGVSPPFDYVPATEAAYLEHLDGVSAQITGALHSPDLLLIQEAEDQDICTVTAGEGSPEPPGVQSAALTCGDTNNADGKADALQELALAIAASGGPTYDTAYDRDGADARGIVSAFLYRTDRLSLAAPASVLTAEPAVSYRTAGLAYNTDVSNPKSLNALLPSDVDTSTGVDGSNVYTRAPQVARFTVAARPGSAEGLTLWAVSNHFSSTPDARVGQRREQAAYGAAIVQAIQAFDPAARIVYGGDLNVFPRPDDPIARTDTDTPSDQLGPLYNAGLHNLWEVLAADVPGSAYSYEFQGQAQTLDHLWVTGPLYDDLIQMRAAHINAGYPVDFDGDGPRGVSDHDPQVALFASRARLTVADASVTEGTGSARTPLPFTIQLSRPLSQPVTLCAVAYGITASPSNDFDPVLSCKTLAAGQTSWTVTVPVVADHRKEGAEQVGLFVTGQDSVVYADELAVGTIRDDD
jgi:predicted extracellular nuclease